MKITIDHSEHTALWNDKIRQIQDALRDKKYATALAKIADMQASLIEVDAWVQENHPTRNYHLDIERSPRQ